MDPGQTIYNTLRESGIPDPLSLFVVAQAKHETANFTSNVFKTCNNAFGYKAVGTAFSCSQAPEGGSYEYYPGGVADSAREIAAYLKRRVSDGKFPPLVQISTPEQYAALLKSAGYYGAPLSEYTAGLLRWLQRYETSIIGAGSVLLIGAVIWLLLKKN
jgi:hypothetical protein